MDRHDIKYILDVLPHRYPFLLIDRVIELIPNQSIIAIKNVTINEPFFSGHFPEEPIMPGVMILEALAQASGILAFQSVEPVKPNFKRLILFAGIDEARFKKIVIPGDQLVLKAKILRVKNGIWKSEVEALVENQVVCAAIMLGAIKDIPSD